MTTEIVKILEAGESCEVVSSERYGKIWVSRPILHNFKKYPLIYMEPDVNWNSCCDEDAGRLVVTIEGLGFSKPRTIFADDSIELVSKREVVLIEPLPSKMVQISIMPL